MKSRELAVAKVDLSFYLTGQKVNKFGLLLCSKLRDRPRTSWSLYPIASLAK